MENTIIKKIKKMMLTIICKNGIAKEFIYLENKSGFDFYRVTQNSPAVKIELDSHQHAPKGWCTPSYPKIIPKVRQSKRQKTQPKRLGNSIPSNIIKFVQM